MMMRICYFVPDTNVFLHYQTFTEINWPRELEVDQATLVICPSVMRELDQSKFSDPDSRIRERARKVVSELATIHENNKEVRENVKLLFVTREPGVDWSCEGLNPDVQDDWIIAFILCERKNMDPLVLVTSDYGLKLKAESRKITSHRLRDELLLPPSKSPQEQELARLRKRVAVLESRLPDLTIQLLSDGELTNVAHYRLSKPSPVLPGEEEKKVSEMKGKLEYVPLSRKPRFNLGGFYDPPSEDEVERYREDVDRYMERLRRFFDGKRKYQDEMARTMKIRFALANNGSAPAEDIDISLYFPDGFEVREEGDLPREPEPAEPTRPRTKMQISMGNIQPWIPEVIPPTLSRYPIVPDRYVPSDYPSKPSIKKINSYEVRYPLELLRELRGDLASRLAGSRHSPMW